MPVGPQSSFCQDKNLWLVGDWNFEGEQEMDDVWLAEPN